MRVIIDRFEEDFAVLELDEGRKTVNAPRVLFEGAKEGDCVEITVLGKTETGGETTREIFGRLREKSRGKAAAKPRKKPKEPS